MRECRGAARRPRPAFALRANPGHVRCAGALDFAHVVIRRRWTAPRAPRRCADGPIPGRSRWPCGQRSLRPRMRQTARRRAARCCATRSGRRDRLRSGPGHRSVLATSCWRTSSKRRWTYDFLARPVERAPNTAAAMPEVSADFTHASRPHQPGIYFADDPAFKGQQRELVAAGLRLLDQAPYDPRWKSADALPARERRSIVGLSELRARRIESKKPFDYDREVEGLRALDRYTLPVKLGAADAALPSRCFTDPALTGAVAREVVEVYGDTDHGAPGRHRAVPARRVAAQLAHRARAQPDYREVLLRRARAGRRRARAGDRRASSRAASCRWSTASRSTIIEEPQPRWLAFLNGEHDWSTQVPDEFAERRDPERQARAEPRQARHPDGRATRATTSSMSLLRHGASGGRRLHARQGRAAPRDRAGLRRRATRSALARKGQAIPAQSHRGAAGLRATTRRSRAR